MVKFYGGFSDVHQPHSNLGDRDKGETALVKAPLGSLADIPLPSGSNTNIPLVHLTPGMQVACESRKSSHFVITGRRGAEHSEIRESRPIRLFSWDGSSNQWRADTMVFNISDGVMRKIEVPPTLDHIPRTAPYLSAILREVLFSNFLGPPTLLQEALERTPTFRGRSTDCSISSPLPVYYRSGLSKDVWAFRLFIFPHNPHAPYRQLLIALKIAHRDEGISDDEMHYHQVLTQHQSFHDRVATHLLGFADLRNFENLKLPLRKVALEIFEPGQTTDAFIDGPAHQTTAIAVTRCSLRLIDVACRGGLGSWDFGDRGTLLRVQFPSDINHGNFILGTNGAILCDNGANRPEHTFSEVMLRLIQTYWHFAYPTESPRKFDLALLLPLDGLFTTIHKHYGTEKATALLNELGVTLSLLTSVSMKKIEERFPQAPLDSMTAHLAHSYGAESGENIAHAWRRARHTFADQLRRLGEEENEEVYLHHAYKAKAPMLEASERQLRHVLEELLIFRKGSSKIEVCHSDFRRRLHAFESHFQIHPKMDNPALYPFRDRAHSKNRVAKELRSHALLFKPFPDPSIIKLAMSTVRLSPWFSIYTKPHDEESAAQYQRRVLVSAGVFLNMFTEQDFTAELAEVMSGVVRECFHGVAGAYHHFKQYREAQYDDLVEKWVGLSVGLFILFQRQGPGVLTQLAAQDRLWFAFFNDYNQGDLQGIFEKLTSHFPEIIDPAFSTQAFSKEGLALIHQATLDLCPILRARHPHTPLRSFPKVVFNPTDVTKTVVSTPIETPPDQ